MDSNNQNQQLKTTDNPRNPPPRKQSKGMELSQDNINGSLTNREKSINGVANVQGISASLNQSNAFIHSKSLAGENDQQQKEEGDSQILAGNQLNKDTRAKWRIHAEQFLDKISFVIFMTILTVYSLFFDDIRAVACQPWSDQIFWGLTLFCLICFATEIIVACVVKEGYFLSFFFWLDIISTVTMITDCGWIWNPIISSGSSGGASKTASLAKTTRASRITRVIRIIRLIRLIRIVKLYKQAKLAQEQTEQNQRVRVRRQNNRNRVGGYSGSNSESGQNVIQGLSSSIPEGGLRQTGIDNSAKHQKAQPLDKIDEEENVEEHKNGVGEDSFDQELKNIDNRDKFSMKKDSQSVEQSLADRRVVVLSDSHNVVPTNKGEQSVFEKSGDVSQYEQLANSNNEHHEEEAEIQLESKISKTLSEKNTRIVIILVLILLIVLPLFDPDTFSTVPTLHQQGLKVMGGVYDGNDWVSYQTAVTFYINQTLNAKYPLAQLQIPDPNGDPFNQNIVTINGNVNINNLRTEEQDSGTVYSNRGPTLYVAYSTKNNNTTTSLLNIMRTIFVCVVLAAASIVLTNDANRLVLAPIERMLEKVKLIAKDPLAATSEQVDNAGIYTMMAQKNKGGKQQKADAQFETAMLEKAIVKIGHLLAIGFGEAGSKIIAQNMSSGGDVDPMMAGQRIFAVFGFCDIRNFTDATEILQTEVMLFVNQIAEIAHSQVDKYGGATNKNIGDAFLLVWKYKNLKDFAVENTTGKISHENQNTSDLAIFSFIKIIAKINKLSHILEYRNDPALNERMPDYKVKMGFGIHQGWAIEGAIGSFFKIDASYLSPNVNMAARLEAATKQYGVVLLISGSLYDCCSDDIKMLCREIDTVTVKGSIQPMRFFTVDMDFDNMQAKPDRFYGMTIKEKKSIRDAEKKKLHLDVETGKKTTWDIYSRDKDFKELRKRYDRHFNKKFGEAYKKYISGDWATAEDLLTQCLKMNNKDGPTLTLKSYIDELNCRPPANWKGFRELTDK